MQDLGVEDREKPLFPRTSWASADGSYGALPVAFSVFQQCCKKLGHWCRFIGILLLSDWLMLCLPSSALK